MEQITFAWTNDDAGSGGTAMIESVERSCEYLESRGLRGTWFVVPKPRGEPLTDAWVRCLCAARDRGHDLQLHGLTHEDCWEFGPPVRPAVTISPQIAEGYRERREELRQRYTVEKLRARLEEGLEIFDGVLGVQPTVFRAPCGSICPALYEALAQVGMRYETSQYLNLGTYYHLEPYNRPPEAEWTDAYPYAPFRWFSGVTQVPMLGEYTWRHADRYPEEFRALACADADRIAAESPVGVLLSHTHGIAANYEYAFATFDALLEHLDARGMRRFATLGELALAGRLDPAPGVEGPVEVPNQVV
jgi:peptidoglycan/xylan/chitin deacetylase (PgdA/CDA1 family)